MTGKINRGSKIRLLPLIAATYFMVSGGPYGLEDIIGKAGYGHALLLLLLVPLVWSLPTSLMVGELASALPYEGGYYYWVRRAMGGFWGFQEAWLSLAASVFDMAIYPVIVVLYLGRIEPAWTAGYRGVCENVMGTAGGGTVCGVESARSAGGGRGISRAVLRAAVAVRGADCGGAVEGTGGRAWSGSCGVEGAGRGRGLRRGSLSDAVELHGVGQCFDGGAGGGAAAEELSKGDAGVGGAGWC